MKHLKYFEDELNSYINDILFSENDKDTLKFIDNRIKYWEDKDEYKNKTVRLMKIFTISLSRTNDLTQIWNLLAQYNDELQYNDKLKYSDIEEIKSRLHYQIDNLEIEKNSLVKINEDDKIKKSKQRAKIKKLRAYIKALENEIDSLKNIN